MKKDEDKILNSYVKIYRDLNYEFMYINNWVISMTHKTKYSLPIGAIEKIKNHIKELKDNIDFQRRYYEKKNNAYTNTKPE